MGDLYTQIGERIKQAREDQGWTQAQLGEALGYSQAAIGNYELGRRHIGLDDLYKIAEALNKPYSYFLGVDKQVEAETRRELEQKVRRDMADFVGVRMLPVISKALPAGAPLEAGDVEMMMPVPREMATGADLVFRVPPQPVGGQFSEGDLIFVSRSPQPGASFVVQAEGLVKISAETSPASMVVLGSYCGLYSSLAPTLPTGRAPAAGAVPPGWTDLSPADQDQAIQFIAFMRARNR